MPTVTRLDLFAVDLPFKIAFEHAAASRTTSDSIFLRMRLDDGVEGWGECLPRVYVSGETRETAFALLKDSILPAVVGATFASPTAVVSFLKECDGKAPATWVRPDVAQTAAWCSVDLALLDAFCRASGESVRLGADSADPSSWGPLRFSGVVSADRGWHSVVSLLKMRAFRFPHVKVKVEPNGAVRAAQKARRILGRRVDLRVDANMAWDVEQALDVIGHLRDVDIRSVEQPLQADDLAGLARLVRESGAEIVVDEGLTDRDSLQKFIAHRACTGANVRISKCGGLVAAHARAIEALDAGLMLQIGCQVGESSLLSAAQLTLLGTLAARTPGVRYAEGSFGRHLLRADPVSPVVQFRYGGRPPRRPTGPGMGVDVDPVELGHWVVDQARIS